MPKNYRKAALIQEMRPLGLLSAVEACLAKYDILTFVFEPARAATAPTHQSHFDQVTAATALCELKVWLPPLYTTNVAVRVQDENHLNDLHKTRSSTQTPARRVNRNTQPRGRRDVRSRERRHTQPRGGHDHRDSQHYNGHYYNDHHYSGSRDFRWEDDGRPPAKRRYDGSGGSRR